MQTYGKFFIRPKTEKENVDKWSIVREAKMLFYEIDHHVTGRRLTIQDLF